MTDTKIVTTACGFCHTTCGLKISVKNGYIVKVNGNPEHPANSGAICVKGAAIKELVYAPDRLKYPLRKTRGGF